MENIVDIMKALPGERFKFRMIGKPRSWYRYFKPDGTYIESEHEIEGSNPLPVFATFAIDRDTDSLCIVIMHNDLATDLSRKFNVLGIKPNGENGVDVSITVNEKFNPRYFVDIGRCSKLDNPELVDKMDSIWENLMELVVLLSEDEDVKKTETVVWKSPEWPSLLEDIYDIDEVAALASEGQYKEILLSFLIETASDDSCDMATLASKILKTVRIHG